VIIRDLEWDDVNVEHIARHDVNIWEVEDICFEPHLSFRGHNRRYILYGKTSNGRYLKVVLESLSDAIFRPVTALDMTTREKHNYRMLMKKRGL